MKVITLHVEESADALTPFGDIADILEALALQRYGKTVVARLFLEQAAERARKIEEHYQAVAQEVT